MRSWHDREIGWKCDANGRRPRNAAKSKSSCLPDLPPGREFRGADSIAREIAFMQVYKFGFGQLGKPPAAVGINLFLRPSCYSRCGIRPAHSRSDEVGDEFAKLFAVAKPEGVGFPERLANGSVSGG